MEILTEIEKNIDGTGHVVTGADREELSTMDRWTEILKKCKVYASSFSTKKKSKKRKDE